MQAHDLYKPVPIMVKWRYAGMPHNCPCNLSKYHSGASTHTHLTALCPGLPWWAATRKVKPIWILLKQETVGGSGISWAICMSAPRSRQTTTPAPHHSYVFYGPDALRAAQPRRASGHSGASSSENSQHPWSSCKNSDMISLIGVIMDIVVHVLNCYKTVA